MDRIRATQDITQLYARYADAVWRHDYDAFAQCFASEGEWRISGMQLRGRSEIRTTIERIMERFHRVRIVFAAPILDHASASARVQMTEHCAWKNGDTNISFGTYYDRHVLEFGRWRFAWRLFEMDYRGPPDLTGTFFEPRNYGPPPAMPPLDAGTPDLATARWGLTAQTSPSEGGGSRASD